MGSEWGWGLAPYCPVGGGCRPWTHWKVGIWRPAYSLLPTSPAKLLVSSPCLGQLLVSMGEPAMGQSRALRPAEASAHMLPWEKAGRLSRHPDLWNSSPVLLQGPGLTSVLSLIPAPSRISDD